MHIKPIAALIAACFSFAPPSQAEQLEGFTYGAVKAPTGQEWQSPGHLSHNKLQPRAAFSSFATVESARKVLPENSEYRISLDGTWKFHFAKDPDTRPAGFFRKGYETSSWDDITVPGSWNIQGIQKDGSLKYGVPIYVNQPVIFYHEVKVDDWRNGVMRTPPQNWTTYEYRNEVGSFRRNFTIPRHWDGRQVFIEFGGVDSFFYLWINGKYVGFSKNSRDAARFDITDYARKGDNEIAVEVYRSSDGSFLEAQDMVRLPGIYRSVSVYSTPKVHISDIVAKPTFAGGQWGLDVDTKVENLSKKDAKGVSLKYRLFLNKLYSDDNTPAGAEMATAAKDIAKASCQDFKLSQTVGGAKPWTGEEPNVYVLVATLVDKNGREIESVSTQVGFRTVEIKDTPAEEDEFGLAGRYFYVNGKPVKLKGVNRHETNPETGKVVSRSQMEEEIMLMKRANINHVRTSHYPNDPYWYHLCNKYGIYLEAEANIESHEYYYGDASLSHPAEWRPAHVARVMEMVRSRVNDPSIVIWSPGNEAGPGDNFVAAYQAIKAFDATRPVQYERNNSIVDMGSNQYPSIAWTREAVKGKMGIKYPFHISEYAHSMGNAVGNLADYWQAIESTNFFCGGAIWDWIDQSMYYYDKRTGEKFLAYGGDFGDTPNDGQFVMNGIIFADMQPKPQYYEVKKVYQYAGFTATDPAKGLFDIFNKNYYTDDLSAYNLTWKLTADGKEAKSGTAEMGPVAPRSHKAVAIPEAVQGLDPAKEYRIHLQLTLKEDTPWAKAGYVQAEEQFLLQAAAKRPAVAASGKTAAGKAEDGKITVDGDGFKAVFNQADGSIYSLEYDGKKVIEDGCGPKLDAFRAWVNNDNWAYGNWYANGLRNLQHRTLGHSHYQRSSDGSTILSFTIESQAPCGQALKGGDKNYKDLEDIAGKPFGPADFKFVSNVVYTVYPTGDIELRSSIVSNKPTLTLPRLGYVVKLPKAYDNFKYYGRGPVDNYPDRKTGQMVGLYGGKVAAEVVNFAKPQDMANHQDTRWCSLADNGGHGIVFATDSTMSVSALPWAAQQMDITNHIHELPQSDGTYLHLDAAITGLGGNSCGQGPPLAQDQVKAAPRNFGFIIRPLRGADPADVADVSLSGPSPISVSRDYAGTVTISSANHGAELYYKVDGARRAVKYTGPFNLRKGGTIEAYDKAAPNIAVKQRFDKIETIPFTVVFASSVESGEGDAAHLADGDPATIWHTMYSVTVAQYPHWVEFDCGDAKTLRGFSYTPRQDGDNGNIKGYRVQTSMDGKTWGEVVAEGEFANNRETKKVLFPKPVKARYLKFTALSSQNGQDFASGAEFSIIE